MSSSIKQKVRVKLAIKSYNRCAFPDCNKMLVEDGGAILGEAAHIRGEKPGSARHDPHYPTDKVNEYENLIYLCPNCHTRIDKQPNTYTIDEIIGWKAAHQKTMRDRTADVLPDVGFAQLEIITGALIDADPASGSDLNVTPPEEKIRKNKLSKETRFQISMGLSKSPEVRAFIREISTLVPGFDERLVGGFRAKYDSLVDEGVRGDELFDEMLRFACNGKPELVIRAAGLAVLSYLFETCDVFEK